MSGVLIVIIGGGLVAAVVIILGVALLEQARYALCVVARWWSWRRKLREARRHYRRYS